jgi:hypothetical protein
LLTIVGKLHAVLGLHAPVGQDVAQLSTVLAEDFSDQQAAVAVDRLAAAAHQR